MVIIHISQKYSRSVDIICISWKYPRSVDIIRILWIYVIFVMVVDIIRISRKYPRSMDIIRILWIYVLSFTFTNLVKVTGASLPFLLLLFIWPPFYGVCPNHEVVMFQPQTVTPQYLGSVVNCCVSYSTLLNPLLPSQPSAWFLSGGGVPATAPVHSTV